MDAVIAPTQNTQRNEIGVKVTYFDPASESGVIVAFISDGDDPQFVNFTRSITVALDRSTSVNYTLPFQLYPGQHRVLVYDVEEDGTLQEGIGYPAFDGRITASDNSEGEISRYLCTGLCRILATGNGKV